MKNPLMPQKVDELAAMRMGTSYSDTISCRDFSFRVRPLSMLETLHVAQEVQVEMNKLDSLARNALTENATVARITLVKASTSEVGKNDSPLTDYVLMKMTPEEIIHLMKQYVAVIDRANPSLELIPPEKLQELVAALKKSPAEGLALELTALSFSQLVSLCHALIRQS